MLQENPTIQVFYKWQNNLRSFVKKLPGYVDHMLENRPDYSTMGRVNQERLKDIYENIHGWLEKAISLNTKATNKTKTLKMSPYPDLVGWWKAVTEIFALSKTQLKKLKKKLSAHHQDDQEKCVTFSSRFEECVASLKDMGVELDDHKLVSCYLKA